MFSVILNASLTIRRLIALALAALAACVLAWVALAAFDSVASVQARIEENRELLGQLQSVAALAQRVGGASHVTAADPEFLSGESEAIIRGGLQTRLNAIAAINGASVLSAGNAPALSEGGVDFIGLRANLSGPLEGIHNAVLAIETSLPVLFIREATLRTTDVGPASGRTGDPELFADILFYGPLQTPVAPANSAAKR